MHVHLIVNFVLDLLGRVPSEYLKNHPPEEGYQFYLYSEVNINTGEPILIYEGSAMHDIQSAGLWWPDLNLT